jgi:hypothetical protein
MSARNRWWARRLLVALSLVHAGLDRLVVDLDGHSRDLDVALPVRWVDRPAVEGKAGIPP